MSFASTPMTSRHALVSAPRHPVHRLRDVNHIVGIVHLALSILFNQTDCRCLVIVRNNAAIDLTVFG